MNIRRALSVAAFAAIGLVSAFAAQANVISGRLWHVPEAVTFLTRFPANVPGTTADVTFDVNSPMNFNATGALVSTWLASSSAFNIVENTAGTLGSLMDDGTVGTILEFTGFVTVATGQMFTVTHDDGLTLIIGGLDLGFNPGPTSPTVRTRILIRDRPAPSRLPWCMRNAAAARPCCRSTCRSRTPRSPSPQASRWSAWRLQPPASRGAASSLSQEPHPTEDPAREAGFFFPHSEQRRRRILFASRALRRRRRSESARRCARRAGGSGARAGRASGTRRRRDGSSARPASAPESSGRA